MVGGALKKLAIVVLLVGAACRRQTVVTTNVTPRDIATGGATPREALKAFLDAAKAQDLQAMSLVWGTKNGPAAATMDRAALEQREVILACYLKHDTYRIVSETPAAADERVIDTELTFKNLTRSSNFSLTPGPDNRWFVRSFDADALRDLCAAR
jgi:hypothetical protein